ncbi:hypothetical protein THII_0016 [Thioploca ingrica]|uniref:Fibronectin type-III domain-containing protein n=1 Tax=Thioploca ingrica TaxID=40754 RepID=A0A090AA77_9GAMM|nr:hypothetical protein THII_0016 [Thioploca ingrica]
MLKVGTKFLVPVVSLSLLSFSNIGIAAGCGPGEHWVDKCPEGIDQIENHWAVMKLSVTDPATSNPVVIPIESLQGSPQFRVYRGAAETGPVTITAPPVPTDPPTPSEIGPETFGPIEPPADPPAPHDPHRGVIQTEIISLVFKGNTKLWGDVVIRAGDGTGNLENDGPLYSPGVIYEDLTDSTKACSVFFVTYEMEIKATGELLYGQTRMATCNDGEPQAMLGLPPENLEYKDPRWRPIRNKLGQIIAWVFHKHPVVKSPTPPQGCLCGPGLNWWQDCPAATDSSPSTALINIEIPCGGEVHTVPFSGKTIIDRTAWDGDSIDLSMFSMVLKDPTKQYTVRTGSKYGLSALGLVTPTINPWLANIGFDIFFEIDTPFGKLHNLQPHKMGTSTYCLPPLWEEHIPPTNAPPTILYNEAGEAVARINGARHVLDVKLQTPLQAEVVGNSVTLKWTTAYEHDVVGFAVKRKAGSGEVCRSTLGYESISGILPSQGEESSYTLSDNLAATGNYCYRLVEVDSSGNTVPVAPEQQADFIASVTVN